MFNVALKALTRTNNSTSYLQRVVETDCALVPEVKDGLHGCCVRKRAVATTRVENSSMYKAVHISMESAGMWIHLQNIKTVPRH